MLISDDTFKIISDLAKLLTPIAAILGSVVTIVVAVFRFRKVLNTTLRSSWHKAIKPFLKILIASGTLLIPNGFFIGFWLYQVAISYFEAGSTEFIITSPRVFWQLVAWQTVLVSAYSFLWAVLVYPRIRTWFFWWANPAVSAVKSSTPEKEVKAE